MVALGGAAASALLQALVTAHRRDTAGCGAGSWGGRNIRVEKRTVLPSGGTQGVASLENMEPSFFSKAQNI